MIAVTQMCEFRKFVCTMSYRDVLDTVIKIIVFYLTFSLLYNQSSGETLLCHYYFWSTYYFQMFLTLVLFSLTGHILQSPSANVLPTLPFHVLRSLFSATPLTTDDGVLLRRMALEIGALHLILVCLSALSHHAPRVPNSSLNQTEVGFIPIILVICFQPS